jgi:hypothetical protein
MRKNGSPRGRQAWRCSVLAREYNTQWVNNNREHFNAYCRRWRAANPEKHATYVRNWQKSNPEKVREGSRRRNARRLYFGGIYSGRFGFTQAEIRGIVDGTSD